MREDEHVEKPCSKLERIISNGRLGGKTQTHYEAYLTQNIYKQKKVELHNEMKRGEWYTADLQGGEGMLAREAGRRGTGNIWTGGSTSCSPRVTLAVLLA